MSAMTLAAYCPRLPPTPIALLLLPVCVVFVVLLLPVAVVYTLVPRRP